MDLQPGTGEVGADLRNAYPAGDHVHQHPHRGSDDGLMHGEPHSHSHDHAHDRDADSDGGHDGFGVGMANEYGTAGLGGDFDLSGMDATPWEIGQVLDAVSEAEAETGAGGYDRDAEAAAQWVNGLSDAEFDEMLAEFEADQHLPGPELAGADAGNVIDLAGDVRQIDRMLSQMQDKERIRQAEDLAERGGRRGSTEIRLANAMRRLDKQTYLYGQADLANAPWQGDPDIDGLFSAGPRLNALEIQDQMRYQLTGGARPQGRGTFRPPVRDLAARIGLR